MRVHLLSSRAVARDLSENRLSESDRAMYLALGWILYIVLGYSTIIYSSSSRTWIGFAEFASVLAVAIWGLMYAFRSNGGKDGQDFIVRFTCLLLPASVVTHIAVWGMYYALAWVFQGAVPEMSFSTKEGADRFLEASRYLPFAMTYLAALATQFVIFLIIAHHLKALREAASCGG